MDAYAEAERMDVSLVVLIPFARVNASNIRLQLAK